MVDVTDDELTTLMAWQADEAKRHAGMPCRHAIHLKAVDLMLDDEEGANVGGEAEGTASRDRAFSKLDWISQRWIS